MPSLIVGTIDFNDSKNIQALINAVVKNVQCPGNYHVLVVKNCSTFSTPNSTPPSENGWYIILKEKIPIYVGKADNLNNRLNSPNGSRDNFNNSKRKSDPIRNFIKKSNSTGFISDLRVLVVTENNLKYNFSLSDLDRDNIEKILSMYRSVFQYL